MWRRKHGQELELKPKNKATNHTTQGRDKIERTDKALNEVRKKAEEKGKKIGE